MVAPNPLGPLLWEDVQTYLAVARAGSLSGAAQSLAVHHSTVFRRLERLERHVGAELFARSGRRYRPTPAGEAFEAHARRIEDEFFALERTLLGSDLMPSGTLRFTTLETLLPWVMPALRALQARCPDLTVELDATTQTRSLDRRDADMALRPSESPPEQALGRRIAALGWALYSPAHSHRQRSSQDPLPLLQYVGAIAQLEGPRAVSKGVASRAAVPRFQARSVAAMAEGIAAGVGRGALPCYIGDSDRRLARAGEAIVPEGSALWLLRHPDLRDSPRIRVLIDLIVPALEPHRALFSGECPARRATSPARRR